MPTFDTSGLRSLSVTFAGNPSRVAPQVLASVKKAAVNIKSTMQADLEGSKHFKAAARDVTFDLEVDSRGFSAEIGPETGRGDGHAGGLAHIAYNGGARGGGGSVRDPQEALDEEMPKFQAALGNILDGTL